MTAAFDRAFTDLMQHEGGAKFTDHPADRGGPTKYGISQRAYPDVNIGELTEEQAKAIYRRDFWDRLQCDLLPPQIAIKLFNVAVNMGIRPAAKLLQEALNFLRTEQLAVDGVLGPVTRTVILAYPNAEAIVAAICGFQFQHYRMLIGLKASQKVFVGGWTMRAMYRPT